ncbi:hypothetical protein FB45DRAFT_1008820 [Roridomyces roridus]|uniref:Uncharacterized protein n=1 Tax=Roridomyces roridus TaxID=1738132 RepID=A0AAD7B8J4_9AGAR|nr:hypothetical protein FB45DRAFT_1008820 [Roridomyces roridus]
MEVEDHTSMPDPFRPYTSIDEVHPGHIVRRVINSTHIAQAKQKPSTASRNFGVVVTVKLRSIKVAPLTYDLPNVNRHAWERMVLSKPVPSYLSGSNEPVSIRVGWPIEIIFGPGCQELEWDAQQGTQLVVRNYEAYQNRRDVDFPGMSALHVQDKINPGGQIRARCRSISAAIDSTVGNTHNHHPAPPALGNGQMPQFPPPPHAGYQQVPHGIPRPAWAKTPPPPAARRRAMSHGAAMAPQPQMQYYHPGQPAQAGPNFGIYPDPLQVPPAWAQMPMPTMYQMPGGGWHLGNAYHHTELPPAGPPPPYSAGNYHEP